MERPWPMAYEEARKEAGIKELVKIREVYVEEEINRADPNFYRGRI